MKSKEKCPSADSNLSYGERKISFLNDYLTISKCLNTKASHISLSEILNLLNQRQDIIRKINNLDAQGWEIAVDNWNLGNSSADESLSIRQRMKEIVREIEYLDNQLRGKFISWREEVKKELMANQLAFKTIHTYAQAFTYQGTPRFLDMWE